LVISNNGLHLIDVSKHNGATKRAQAQIFIPKGKGSSSESIIVEEFQAKDLFEKAQEILKPRTPYYSLTSRTMRTSVNERCEIFVALKRF
jgi:hypothetical protein